MADKVSDFLLKRLSEWGVKRLFGYPGDGILGIMSALGRHPELIAFLGDDEDRVAVVGKHRERKSESRRQTCRNIHPLVTAIVASIDPAVILLVENVATPLPFTGAVLATPSTVNVTVPVGAPAADETVAGKVTDWPNVDGLVAEVTTVGVVALGVIMVLSGLAIWKPGQFQELTFLFGGFDLARVIHFLGMAGIVLFLIIHIALVIIVPKTVPTMITGRAPVCF